MVIIIVTACIVAVAICMGFAVRAYHISGIQENLSKIDFPEIP